MNFIGFITLLVIVSALAFAIVFLLTSRKMFKYEAAKNAIKNQNWNVLLKTAKEILEKDKDNPLPYYYTALAYKKKHHFIKCYEYLKMILDKNLCNEQVPEKTLYSELALIAERIGNEADAYKYNTLLMKEGMADKEVFFRMGKHFFKEENYSQALKHFKECIKADKYFSRVYPYMGITLFNLNNYSKAVQYLKSAAADTENFPEINFYLAEIYFNQDDISNARQLYQHCIDNKINEAESYARLGDILRKQGKHEEAVNNLKQALTIGKDNDQNWLNEVKYQLGLTYSKTSRVDKAINLWQEIKSSDHTFKDIELRVNCFSYLNKFQKNSELTRVFSLNPKGFEMQCELILKKMHHDSFNFEKAGNNLVICRSRYNAGSEQFETVSFFSRGMTPVTEAEVQKLIELIREEKYYSGNFFTWYIFSEEAKKLDPPVSLELYNGEAIARVIH